MGSTHNFDKPMHKVANYPSLSRMMKCAMLFVMFFWVKLFEIMRYHSLIVEFESEYLARARLRVSLEMDRW